MAAAELAPPLTYMDASGMERPVSEWEGGEADAEEVGLRCANPTYIERPGTAPRTGAESNGLAAFRAESQHEGQTAGGLLRREWFQIVDDFPHEARPVRFWDMAATEPQPGTDPDWTVGVLMEAWRGQFWSVDVQRLRGSPPEERRPGRCILWVGKDYRLKMRRLSGGFNAGIHAGP